MELKQKNDAVKAVSKNGLKLGIMDEIYRDDAEVVMAAVKNNGMSLKYASDRLRRVRNIVFTAIYQNPYAIQYASPEILSDREIVMEAVKRNGAVIRCLGQYSDDDQMIWMSCITFPYALEYASDNFLKNRDDVEKAVSLNPAVIRHIPSYCKWKKTILENRYKKDEYIPLGKSWDEVFGNDEETEANLPFGFSLPEYAELENLEIKNGGVYI